jgi:hypothetical protein
LLLGCCPSYSQCLPDNSAPGAVEIGDNIF